MVLTVKVPTVNVPGPLRPLSLRPFDPPVLVAEIDVKFMPVVLSAMVVEKMTTALDPVVAYSIIFSTSLTSRKLTTPGKSAPGRGNTIGFDPVAKIGGMAHVVLPKSHGKSRDKGARYADVAVPLLFKKLRECGAVDSRLVINLVGGAQMSLAPGMGTAFKIGEDNVAAVRAALAAEGLKPKAIETGGHRGRTMRLLIESGKAMVASAGEENREL